VLILDNGRQAFCGNEQCSTLAWSPCKSIDENLLEVNFVDLRRRAE
jgi:hypothetical protein